MKHVNDKFIQLFQVLLLSLGLAACQAGGNSPPGTTPPATPPESPEPPAVTTPAPGAGTNTAGGPSTADASISAQQSADAQMPDREVSIDQLPVEVRNTMGISEFAPQGSGTLGHPFTTKRASAVATNSPIDLGPWRATGKLFTRYGGSTFVCTASVIRKNLLVTAAHCVHRYGQGQQGWPDAVSFEPARYEGQRPFGTWSARQWWIPTVYFNGTDTCQANAPGVVCENDIAVVVMNKNSQGQTIGDVVGMYDFKDDMWGYVDFLGNTSTQITQLGYPSKNYAGDKMIRTDSLGYWASPSNVIIGSNQTGGSSGGPWLMNFGTATSSFTGTPPKDNESNQVVATTSWGYTNDAAKVQGASRFARNNAYPNQSNIQSLVNSACNANPGAC